MHKELQAFESRADAEIAKLALWRQPIRTILSSIYLSADGHYIGGRFNRKGPRDDEVGTAIITRMSYVLELFATCSRAIGADLEDAMSVVDERFATEMAQVLGYAHFSEIMPLAWRGFFVVDHEPPAFIFRHPDDDFVRYEENDILMSEMVLPHDLTPPPYPIENCKKMNKAWPHLPGDSLIEVLKGALDHYLDNLFELPLLSDAAFAESFDFSRVDFVRTRAALMSYADFCLGMADAAEVHAARAVTRPRRSMLQKEVGEWVAPLLNRNHIIGTAAGLSGVDPDKTESIVDLFTLDLDNLKRSGFGEGFFPPFLRLENALLFSPHAVKRMMPERNLLYAMLRTDQERFDNVVSQHLEPALLDDAARYLAGQPDVEVTTNHNWDQGEIDLLAFHEPSNSALQLQAKAAVPPQGARMVAQVESRTREAAEQISRFLALESATKDSIATAAFGRPLSAVTWSSGVLARTCLGTQKAWEAIGAYVPLNLVLLRAAVKRLQESGAFTFANLGTSVEDELASLRAKAALGWQTKDFTLLDTKIDLPLLDLDYASIRAFRAEAMR
ncbi:hypothetical protein [Roseibium sp. M-1]